MEKFFILIKRGMNPLLNKVAINASSLELAKKEPINLYRNQLHENQKAFNIFSKATHVEVLDSKENQICEALINPCYSLGKCTK